MRQLAGFGPFLICAALCAQFIFIAPTADGQQSPDAGGRAGAFAIWHSETVWSDGAAVDGLALGDFDGVPGLECVAGGRSGHLAIARSEGYGWSNRTEWTAPGKITSLCAARYDNYTGNGMIVGASTSGGGGAVFLVSGTGGNLTASELYTGPAPVKAVAAADLVFSAPGGEIASVDELGNLIITSGNGPARVSEKAFSELTISQGSLVPLALSCVLAHNFDSTLPGDELLAGGLSGNLTAVWWQDNWKNRTVWTTPGAIECIAPGDVDPLSPGSEIIIGSSKGDVAVLSFSGGVWKGKTVWSSAEKVLSIGAGDFNGEFPGNELAVATPTGVTMLTYSPNIYSAQRIYDGSACLCLAVGDFDQNRAGAEIVLGTEEGKVLSLGLFRPDISLLAQKPDVRLDSGTNLTFSLELVSLDKYTGKVSLNASQVPTGMTVTFPSQCVNLVQSRMNVAVTASVFTSVVNGQYSFLVTASAEAGMYSSAMLNVDVARSFDFKFELFVAKPNATAGSCITYVASISNTGSSSDSYHLRAGTDNGWKVSCPNNTGSLGPGESKSVNVIVSIPKGAEGMTAKLTANASSSSRINLTHESSMKIIVRKPAGPCALLILPAGVIGTVFMGRAVRRRSRCYNPAHK